MNLNTILVVAMAAILFTVVFLYVKLYKKKVIDMPETVISDSKNTVHREKGLKSLQNIGKLSNRKVSIGKSSSFVTDDGVFQCISIPKDRVIVVENEYYESDEYNALKTEQVMQAEALSENSSSSELKAAGTGSAQEAIMRAIDNSKKEKSGTALFNEANNDDDVEHPDADNITDHDEDYNN